MINTGALSLGIILLYLFAMLALTLWNGKKKQQKTAEGFFLANRGVSSVLLPLTMIAHHAEHLRVFRRAGHVLYPRNFLYLHRFKPGMGGSDGHLFRK